MTFLVFKCCVVCRSVRIVIFYCIIVVLLLLHHHIAGHINNVKSCCHFIRLWLMLAMPRLKHDNGTDDSPWQVSCGLDPLACYSRGENLTPKSYFIVQLQCRGGIEIIAAQINMH